MTTYCAGPNYYVKFIRIISIGGGKYIRANNAQFNGFSNNIACKAGGSPLYYCD